MAATLRSGAFVVWLVLVAVTGTSWLLGSAQGDVALTGLLALTFVKVWLIGEWFMELREAPWWLRRAFGAWAAVFGSAAIAFQLAA